MARAGTLLSDIVAWRRETLKLMCITGCTADTAVAHVATRNSLDKYDRQWLSDCVVTVLVDAYYGD